jgi:hypothetical protein
MISGYRPSCSVLWHRKHTKWMQVLPASRSTCRARHKREITTMLLGGVFRCATQATCLCLIQNEPEAGETPDPGEYAPGRFVRIDALGREHRIALTGATEKESRTYLVGFVYLVRSRLVHLYSGVPSSLSGWWEVWSRTVRHRWEPGHQRHTGKSAVFASVRESGRDDDRRAGETYSNDAGRSSII